MDEDWVQAQELPALGPPEAETRVRAWFAAITAEHMADGDKASTLHTIGERIACLMRLAPFAVYEDAEEPPMTLGGWRRLAEKLISEAGETELNAELYHISADEVELRHRAMQCVAQWLEGDFIFLAALGLPSP